MFAVISARNMIAAATAAIDQLQGTKEAQFTALQKAQQQLAEAQSVCSKIVFPSRLL